MFVATLFLVFLLCTAQAEEKRSPYGMNLEQLLKSDKRSPYGMNLEGLLDESNKRSPFGGFAIDVNHLLQQKRSPFGMHLGHLLNAKRSPYGMDLASLLADKRSPFGLHLTHLLKNDKRSPFGMANLDSLFQHENDKRSTKE